MPTAPERTTTWRLIRTLGGSKQRRSCRMKQLLRLNFVRAVGLLVFVFLLQADSCNPSNVELTTNTTPVLTVEHFDDWNWVEMKAQGVKGEDPVGFFVGNYPAIKKRPLSDFNNWFPVALYKTTLCGQLDRFEVYDAGWTGAEPD